jgi:hypothetical protein
MVIFCHELKADKNKSFYNFIVYNCWEGDEWLSREMEGEAGRWVAK